MSCRPLGNDTARYRQHFVQTVLALHDELAILRHVNQAISIEILENRPGSDHLADAANLGSDMSRSEAEDTTIR